MSQFEGRDSIEPHEFASAVLDKLGGSATEDTATEAPAVEVAAEEAAATETPDVKLDETGRAHGPDGKFVEKPEETEPAAEEEPPDEETGEPEEEDDGIFELELDDPDVEAFLAKYDGDLGKALKAATEAQRLVGRQGSELGELRQLQGELTALKEMMAAQMQRPQFQGPDPRSLLNDDPKAAAHAALQTGDVNTMMEAVQLWAEEGTSEAFEAALFVSSLQHQFAIDELRQEFAQSQPAAQPSGEDEVGRAVAKVVERHPDLEKYLPAIGAAAQERPLLRKALEEGAPAERAQALEDLYVIARSRDSDTSVEAVRKIQVRTRAEADQAKADAAVVSASQRAAAQAQPTRADAFRTAFRERTGLPLEDE